MRINEIVVNASLILVDRTFLLRLVMPTILEKVSLRFYIYVTTSTIFYSSVIQARGPASMCVQTTKSNCGNIVNDIAHQK